MVGFALTWTTSLRRTNIECWKWWFLCIGAEEVFNGMVTKWRNWRQCVTGERMERTTVYSNRIMVGGVETFACSDYIPSQCALCTPFKQRPTALIVLAQSAAHDYSCSTNCGLEIAK